MSDQDNNIFTGSEDDPKVTEPTSGGEENNVQDPAPSPYATALSGITNEEGKQKFGSVDQALASITPANEHIRQVESENAQMREKLAKTRTAEEILTEIKSTSQPIEASASQAVDMSQIETLVDTRLSALEEAKVARRNEQIVVETLTNHFGSLEKAGEAYDKMAQELGCSREWMNSIAAKSPVAMLKQFDISPTSSPVPVKTTGSDLPITQSTDNAPPISKKSVMYGASTRETIDEWRNAGIQANQLAAQG